LGKGHFVQEKLASLLQQAAAIVWSAQISGDYKGGDILNATNCAMMRNSLGQSGMGLAADGVASDAMAQEDYTVWYENFHASALLSASSRDIAPIP
jgi:hypothetical protein